MWNGEPTTIKSRSTDETGNVQPDRATALKLAGPNAVFHYNGQQAWKIDSMGKVTNALA